MNRITTREEALFADALAQPEAQRGAFLEKACGGDAALQARLEVLLAAHGATENLEPPPVVAESGLLADEKPCDRIGRYKLLLKIGEGGCGVVFLAEQEEPVRRRVALKVIKAGMDTREVIARFEAERQALALMDHPGICKVLDAGATEAGRPFFVMELVRGVPITKYCDENQLPTRARLELFMQVCHAVQHAHQKGIIHRDLKPSNILVTLHGTEAAPKVIDFGIAKATQGRLTDATLVTAYEQLLGTPAYMAPEQVEMNGLDIDTRCDVYSLGVLLYELLTGRPPFDPKSLRAASPDELRRIIREVEPSKPSTHLSTLAAADRGAIARRHGTDPARLRMQLSGDLDWIVMKALEKNRMRRYDTPAAMADDLARHLRHEPVVARPPGNFYRMGKFVRRHRFGVAAAGAVSFVLVTGSIVSTWQAVRATQAEKAADIERRKVVEGRKRAAKLLTFMLEDLRSEVRKVGKLELLALVGTKAADYFASLDPRDLSDEELTQQVKSLWQIGEVQIDKARYAEATTALEAARAGAFTLVSRHPTNGDMLYERAQVEYWIGFLHWRKGDLVPARQWMTRYRDTTVELASMDPGRLDWQRELISGRINLAVLEMERGKISDARAAFLAEIPRVEALIAAYPGDLILRFSLANLTSWLGTAAERQGDFSAALDRYAEQTLRLEALQDREPGNLLWRFRIADSLLFQVDVLAVTERWPEARERLTRALAIFEALVAHDSANRRWLLASLNARMKEVMLDRAEQKLPLAIRNLNEIRPKIETLAAAEPADRNFVGRLVTAWGLEAELRLAEGRRDASDAANRAVERAVSLVDGARADAKILGECVLAHVIAGAAAEGAGRRDVALGHWLRVLEMLKTHLADSSDWRLLDPAARALAFLGRLDDSRAIVTRLHGLGYRPLQRWPDSVASHLPVSSTQKK